MRVYDINLYEDGSYLYNEWQSSYGTTSNQLNDINKYKCYCRSKILPENCPKNKEKENKGGKK